MRFPKNANAKQFFLVLSFFMLTMFLVACGTPASGADTVPIPTPTPTPTPIPTTQTYNGDGYTLQYPLSWRATKQDLTAYFSLMTDPTTIFSVTVNAATSSYDPDASIQTGVDIVKGSSFQDIQTSSTSTTTIGGDSWHMVSITGTYQIPGTFQGIPGKARVMVDQHPSVSGEIYLITMLARADGFDRAYDTSFKSILDSFKFV